MRGEDLLGERCAGARHADDEHRQPGPGAAGVALRQKTPIERGDDPVDALRELAAIVARAEALAELICLPVVVEGRVVLPGVIEVLAERVTQAHLVPEREGLREQRLDPLMPRRVVTGHPAVLCYAAIGRREI